jgi:tetratricopeptide (TPR) repeat protein
MDEITMAVFSYTDLERLIQTEQFSEAETVCKEAIASSSDKLFWRTQLGYVYFLNEQDDEAYYHKSVKVFEELVKDYPNDANAHFWLGYLKWIILNQEENAIAELNEVLEIEPDHPYTHIVLADYNENRLSSVFYLLRITHIQPNNYRALVQFANFHQKKERLVIAKEFYRVITQNPPYVETGYGIMNNYINDVFTWSSKAESVRQQAEELLEKGE